MEHVFTATRAVHVITQPLKKAHTCEITTVTSESRNCVRANSPGALWKTEDSHPARQDLDLPDFRFLNASDHRGKFHVDIYDLTFPLFLLTEL